MRNAIQLYTLRSHGDATVDRVELASEAGFDAVELAGIPDAAEFDDVSREIATRDVDVAAAHVDAELLESEPTVVADRLDEFGCNHVVVPYLSDEAFASPTAVERTARRITTLSEELAAYGLDLSYHNHDHEFRSLGPDADGEAAFDRLLDRTADHVGIELDVGWAVAAGADPVELLERVSGRVDLVHFKDTKTAVPVGLGDGHVDLDRCIAAASEIGAEWAI